MVNINIETKLYYGDGFDLRDIIEVLTSIDKFDLDTVGCGGNNDVTIQYEVINNKEIYLKDLVPNGDKFNNYINLYGNFIDNENIECKLFVDIYYNDNSNIEKEIKGTKFKFNIKNNEWRLVRN